jgi:hypothetical protein
MQGDLAPFRSNHDDVLEQANARRLFQACTCWANSQRFVDLEDLKRIPSDASMQEIIEVHREMKDRGFPNIVADYILEFTNDSGAWWLMVPYVCISGTIPRRFQRTLIGFLDYGSSLPGTMNQLGLLESCMSKKREEGGLLNTICSDPVTNPVRVEYICHYCKRSSYSYALSSMPGSFHALDCPRYLSLE